MADQEQLEVLKQGAYVWNKWREEVSESRRKLFKSQNKKRISFLADLRYANLKGIDLCGADLSFGLFNGANFAATDLSEYSVPGIAGDFL